ncbi:MAG: ABC transporter permease/substrate-binding protein [Bacteroidaceae bacterium]|nr:ABC transporter permease/substrate-binding protein [Bacteroidaceae bacterium]
MDNLFIRRTYFFHLFSEHLLISSLAVFFVVLFGVAIGVWVFYSKHSRTFVLPIINFLYAIPSIAMFGLLIPVVGIGLRNALIVMILYGLLPIVRNTYTGLKEVPMQYVEVARSLGATPFQLFKKIYFPLALPSILSGLRITVVMVIALTGLAALIGAGGLGQAIFRGLNTMNTFLIVAGSLGISLFAILGDSYVGVFEKNNNLQHMISHNATKKQKIEIVLNTSLLFILIIGALWYTNPFAGSDERSVTVASKPTSEQFILGEIVAQTIENHTDITVYRKFGIGGGTTNIQPAILSGKIDLYVEYTGTAWMSVLKEKLDSSHLISFEKLARSYQNKYQLAWLGLLGLNNTYALAISQSDAEARSIRTYSDLAAQSSFFDFGAEFDFFERPDAYNGLLKIYPFMFRSLHEMDINLRYSAFEEGKVNAIDAFTTDAKIEALQLSVLEDDKHYFPSYEAGIVIREATLDRYPEIRPFLTRLNGKISTAAMRKMNYEVEILQKKPKAVAAAFLKTLIEESSH